MAKGPTEEKSGLPTYGIDVRIERGQANSNHFSFCDAFQIGRDRVCDVEIFGDPSVSRQHAEVSFHDGSWWLRDLDSTNGTYVDDRRIDVAALRSPTKVRLGTGATLFSLAPHASRGEIADTFSITLTLRISNMPAGIPK
jgi:pSer/pThr/pTyr-binding forkhead associated (FHA) protein